MKRVSTLFLKTVIVLIAGGVILLCVLVFPVLYGVLMKNPEFMFVTYPGVTGIYLTPVPLFIALFQAFTLLQYVDANTAFSHASLRALQNIKSCAIAISALYAMAMPLMYVFAEIDDAPGVILIWFAVICAPLVVATFIGVVQKLVQSAVDLKAETDLTV